VRDVARDLRVEQFRDAEVEQFRSAGRRYEHVRRFDVSVYDLFLVRVVNGVADRAKQFEPFGDV
jgi:hypothetical protein